MTLPLFRLVATLAAVAPLAGLAACRADAQRTGGAADLHAMAGAHARVVWVQNSGTDPFATGDDLTLMGLDTDDGRGERAIVDVAGSYVKPMLTPRGDRVVYSTHPDRADASVHIVNFDGTAHRRFEPGFALALWQDPADGAEWVYIGTDHRGYSIATVTRVRLDEPSRRAPVWQGDRITYDTFQVSADGRTAGGLFPWPAAGIADLAAGTWRQLGEGCWTALNDPGAPLFWYFDGAHRNLQMVDIGRDRRWTVPINRAPGFENPEVYHPRWTPHPRFMTMSGPYDQGGANQVRSGGNQSEIWIGRFNDDYSRIEAWARATHNARADSYPDVWIDREASPYPRRASGRLGPPETGGVVADRHVVEARLVTAGAIPTPESILPYRHALVVNRYEVVTVAEGRSDARELLVAQWAIRDGRILADGARTPGQLYRLTVERYDAHPELEGERLIQGTDLPDAPLYYAVEQ